jgi:LemA protein
MSNTFKRLGIGIGVILAIILILGLWVRGINNNIVTYDEAINGSWAQVETVLQRRFDLIPNLVSTVKGFAKQEKDVLTEVTELRSQWANAKTVAEKVGTANQLEGALGRLMIISENYPDLKSNQNFMALQAELAGTENRISVERRRYNEAVQRYNSYIRKFPNNIIGSSFNHQVRDDYFKAEKSAESAPKVNFE